MDLQFISDYIRLFGPIVIFVILFCGIVGIPAPEESFLLLLGVLISKNQLSLDRSLLNAFLGTSVGMVVAYVAGYFIGAPFLYKYGKYIGFNEEKLRKAEKGFSKYGKWTILFGFFIPGLRQLSPYLAGISHYTFWLFLILSVSGSAIWTCTFLFLGYYVGGSIDVFYFPLVFGGGFVLYVIWRKFGKRVTA
ncbi:DedA family protein [Bacillus songklensis]|uniref:DedA family protein n=1 Tax=Bacillus songklensis TaxID=1069116 RepID=A0ABV8B9W9_9BACI